MLAPGWQNLEGLDELDRVEAEVAILAAADDLHTSNWEKSFCNKNLTPVGVTVGLTRGE